MVVFRINLEQLQIKLLNEKIINKDHNITEEDLFLWVYLTLKLNKKLKNNH